MNPLVKKEIRLLLPSFGICCALALPNLFFRFNPDGSLQNWWFILPAFVFCGAVAVMLALNSFGEEISSGTFSNLLAQPIPRQKIWETKIALLAVSLLIVGIFWSACGIVRLKMIGHDLNLLDLFTGVGIFGLAVFSGGLWTVLLLRQVAAAFWFTVLVPGFILVMVMGLFADHSDEFGNGMVASVLGLYSLAGFFFARWLFFRAQDIQWSGGTIVLPEMRGLARLKSFVGAGRVLSPRAALWRKEIQLHQSQFVIAFVLVVLHLIVLATRKLGHFSKNSTTELVLESFWALWLVMPLLVGSAAVAEERRLGTHENQLCLPVKRRTQFTVKLLVTIGLSLFLGVVMPLLLEGFKFLPDAHLNSGGSVPNWWGQSSTLQVFIWNCLGTLSGLLPLLTLAGLVVLIGGISFYASTLARNTLQTLAPALMGVVLTWFLIMVAVIPWRSQYEFDFLWHGPLPYFIVFPAMTLTMLALAYWNYQHVLTGWKLGRHNMLVLVSIFVLGVATTSAIYHRAWERLTPYEPPHGAARLALANPAALSTEGGGVSVHLPDGRMWMADVLFDPNTSHFAFILGNINMILSDGHFISGSNWLTARRAVRDLIGIKTDGTLWISEKPRQVSLRQGRWKINEDKMLHLVPVGTETNWNSVMPRGYLVFLTKTDGTLWRWGTTNFEYYARTNRWPGLRAFTPERLGTESNWAEVFQSGYRLCLRKTDGSTWTWGGDTNGQVLLEIENGFTVGRIFAGQAHGQFRSTALIYHGLEYRVGIRDDGTFRIWAHQLLTTNSQQRYADYVWSHTDLQLGIGTNWLAVAGNGEEMVTLKDDGTLWLWNFHRNYYNPARDRNRYEQEVLETIPVRLGTHSDWIAICSNGSPVTTLAADGSLWFWPLGDGFYWGQTGSVFGFQVGTDSTLLDISRKPQFLGNIFGKPD